MAMFCAAHNKCGIHVDVVAGKVERNQALENDGPSGERRGQEHQEARSRAAVRHHIEHRAKAGALLVVSRGVAIEGVKEAGNTVQDRTRSWV